MKRYVVIFLCAFGWSLSYTSVIHACSGGYGGWLKTLDNITQNEILVRGIVVENSGGNSIIRVERYLKGSGDEYILLYQQSPSLFINKGVRGYDYGCSYSKSPVADVGTRAYFSLDQALNGMYITNTAHAQSNMLAIIEDDSGHYVAYHHYHGEINDTGNIDRELIEDIQVSEPEFEAILADFLGQESVLPGISSEFEDPYPRFRELIITTESGQQYVMPIDSYELSSIAPESELCDNRCPIVSPDGGHFAHPFSDNDNRYLIWYSPYVDDYYFSRDGWIIGDRHYTPPHIDAQKLMFSPDGNYLLAWYNSTLSLYAFNLEQSFSMYGFHPVHTLLWQNSLSVTRALTINDIAGHGVWSANSNAFAYWDADGLNWLDLTAMLEPRLIIERQSTIWVNDNQLTDIPSLLELSTTGRFVRYGSNSEWILQDMLNGQVYENALVSPDETSIVRIISASQGDDNSTTENECTAPLSACSLSLSIADGHRVIEAYWQTNDSLVLITCDTQDSTYCNASFHSLDGRYWLYTRSRDENSIPETIDFAYDTIYHGLAWASDDYMIYVDSLPYLDPLDYSTALDSPIISLEWGSPLWYLSD